MTTLFVEVDDFLAAARGLRHEVAENVALCLAGVAGRLQPGLVGVDPAGAAWAADYDAAVRSVLAASAQLADAAARTSQLFTASGHNYAAAEAASTTGGTFNPGDWTALLADPPTVRAPTVPSAGGAGADTPADWWLVEHTVGYLWPAGHQDQLRATADAWRSAARGIDLAAPTPLGIIGSFIPDHIPEADGIDRVCGTLYDHITTLAEHYRALADTCDEYATHLDTCHTAIRDELTDLVVESAALQTGGALLSVVSLGAAQVPTQAAQAARIALAGGRIGRLIDRLIDAARTIATASTRITRLADHLRDTLTGLTTTRIAYAGITQVPTLRRIDRAAMAAKDGETAAKASGAASGSHAATGPARTSEPFKMADSDRAHILDGEADGSGGHRWPGGTNKTPFPQDWTDDHIISKVEDIVASPATVWRAQTGSGGQYMKSGLPAVWRAWEIRDGVRIRVAFEPATGRVRTAFPDDEVPKGLKVR